MVFSTIETQPVARTCIFSYAAVSVLPKYTAIGKHLGTSSAKLTEANGTNIKNLGEASFHVISPQFRRTYNDVLISLFLMYVEIVNEYDVINITYNSHNISKYNLLFTFRQ